jgi:hypothetical protein
MYEEHQSTDGETILTGIPAWGNAKEVLRDRGIEVESVGVLNIYTPDWNTRLPKSRGYVHVHYFNKAGNEVAYYTPCLQYLFIFTTPRVWHDDFKAKLEYP